MPGAGMGMSSEIRTWAEAYTAEAIRSGNKQSGTQRVMIVSLKITLWKNVPGPWQGFKSVFLLLATKPDFVTFADLFV